jgi:hypothetical protein
MFIPDPNFSIPDPGAKKVPDPHQRIKVFLTQTIFSNLSGMVRSGMFIPDPDPLPIPDPGSGSATLVVAHTVMDEKTTGEEMHSLVKR